MSEDSLNRGHVAVIMPLLIREAWQLSMTEHAVACLRLCTDLEFDLILPEVVSAVGTICDCAELEGFRYFHIPIEKAGTATADINCGIDAAVERGAEWIVYAQNDLFVRPGWLEALHEVFEEKPDAGIATLASADLAHTGAATYFGQDFISEGVYGPFHMMRSTWRYDAENFPGPFADTDLIMRCYEQDLRSYRNNRCVIQHLNRQSTMTPDFVADYATAKQRFIDKHGSSGLLMFKILNEGIIV